MPSKRPGAPPQTTTDPENPGSPKPDLSCVPYPRRGLYVALTIPILLTVAAVTVYLGTVTIFLSVAMVLLYLSISVFQAYCCAYQECPYVGGFCPAVMGILPASFLAQLLYSGEEVVRSKGKFERRAIMACASWLGLIVLPLYWLARLGTPFAGGYVLSHAVYAGVFWLTVCPACTIRDICPGGKLQRVLRRTG